MGYKLPDGTSVNYVMTFEQAGYIVKLCHTSGPKGLWYVLVYIEPNYYHPGQNNSKGTYYADMPKAVEAFDATIMRVKRQLILN